MAVVIGKGEQGPTAPTQMQLPRFESCPFGLVTITHEQGDSSTLIVAQLSKGISTCVARDEAVKAIREGFFRPTGHRLFIYGKKSG